MKTLVVIFVLGFLVIGDPSALQKRILEYSSAEGKEKTAILNKLRGKQTEIVPTVVSICQKSQLSAQKAGELLSEWNFVELENLTQQLHHSNSQHRILVCNILAHISRDFKISALVQKLADSDYSVRYAAATALEKLGPKVIPEMLKLTGHSNYKMRANICYVLSKLKAKSFQICKAILPLMEDSEVIVRRNAITSVGEMGEFALPHLTRIYHFLSDESYDVKNSARWSLTKVAKEHEEAVDFLYQRIHTSGPEREDLLRVIREVGVAGQKMVPALKSLVSSTQDPHFYEVVNCIKSLDPKCSISQDFFIMLLQSSNSEDQAAALSTFRYLPENSLSKETLQIIASQFFSSNTNEKRIMAEIFSKNRSQAGAILSTLLPALAEEDSTILIFIIRSLQQTKEHALVITSKLNQVKNKISSPTVKQEIDSTLQLLNQNSASQHKPENLVLSNQTTTKQDLQKVIRSYNQKGKTLTAESIQILGECLQTSPDETLRSLAIQSFQAIPSEASFLNYATKILLNHLNQENNLENQKNILGVIRYYVEKHPAILSQAEEIVHRLKTFLCSPNLQYEVLTVLGEIGEASAVAIPELQDLWHDRCEVASVIWVLGKIGSRASVVESLVIASTKDDREEIRLLSRWAMGKIGLTAAKDLKFSAAELQRLRNKSKKVNP